MDVKTFFNVFFILVTFLTFFTHGAERQCTTDRHALIELQWLPSTHPRARLVHSGMPGSPVAV